MFFIILLDETEGSLVRNSRDRTCTIDIELTEENFSILVSLRLIFTAEVEVNIRHFVAVESEENREWYIMSVLVHTSTALGTVFIFKVITAVDGTVSDKLTISALRAVPMRRQRVDFSDTKHCRNEARTDTSTRADNIAISVGFLDKAFRYHIESREAMPDDWLDLLFKSCTYNLR